MGRTDKYKKMAQGKEVDLIPFMNLMAILIPALMISTEYIKIATIGVSSPNTGPSTPSKEVDPDEKPPLNLNVVASSNGFYIASKNNVLPGQEEQAATGGPTVAKVSVKVYKANEMGKNKEILRVWSYQGKKYVYGAQYIEDSELSTKLAGYKANYGSLQESEAIDYNYPQLQDKLVVIKEAFKDRKGNDQVIISADPNIGFTTVIRIMDTARSRVNEADEKEWLFPQVVLSAGVT